MSTSRQRRTADLREGKAPRDETTRSKSDKPRDRRKQEIPRGCRMAGWQKTGTRRLRDPAEISRQRVEQQATRTEGRSRERTCARRDAILAIAFLARTMSEYAIPSRRRRLRARQTWAVPRVCQSSDLPATATMEQAAFLQIAAAKRVTSGPWALPAKSGGEQASSGADVAACG